MAQRGGRRGKRAGRKLTLTEFWAHCIAAGIPDDLFWQCTPPEWDALLAAFTARERQAFLRSGMVAAEIRNTLRTKKTDRVWTAFDFVKGDKEGDDDQGEPEPVAASRGGLLDPRYLRREMDGFARAHNRTQKDR